MPYFGRPIIDHILLGYWPIRYNEHDQRNGRSHNIGVWRSQVARTLGVGEAVGSNPATPIVPNS